MPTMNENMRTSFLSLPVELFHCIFDHLDYETILLSFNQVCRRFQAVTLSYDRYRIDFSSISKSKFHLICRHLQPSNILSLTLSDSKHTAGQIQLFLSMFHIDQFHRLRHLTLINVDGRRQKTISRRIGTCPLVSLYINVRGNNTVGTLNILSGLREQAPLCKIHLASSTQWLKKVAWPSDCFLQSLTVQKCTKAQLIGILNHLSHLKTLVINDFRIRLGNIIASTTIRSSLTSLTMTSNITMEVIDSLLSLTPALEHLKLIISTAGMQFLDIADGRKWEEIIQSRLPDLNNFEFLFTRRTIRRTLPCDIDSVIEPFRRPFWVDYKRWFVCCERSRIPQLKIALYTLPFCQSTWKYGLSYERTFSSPAVSLDNTMNCINTLDINLSKMPISDIIQQENANRSIPFNHVTRANLALDGDKPLGSIRFLSTLIDISRLRHVSIHLPLFVELNDNLIDNIGILLERAINVCSIGLHTRHVNETYIKIVKTICSILPPNIRQIQIEIRSVSDMKEVYEQIRYVPSLSFRTRSWKYRVDFQEFTKWLTESGRNFSCSMDDGGLHLWLGKDARKIDEVVRLNKRMKTSETSFITLN